MSTQDSPPSLADMEQNVISVISSENSPTSQQPPTTSTSNTTDSPSSPPHPPTTTATTTTTTPSRSPPPGTINMTTLRTALPDIALNSPSTNIIGTPFAHTTSNTPFEYPFPDTSSTDLSVSPPPSHPLFRPGSPHGTFVPPPHPSFHPPPPPPPIIPHPVDIHASTTTTTTMNSTTTFNLIHPKFRAPSPVSPPPIPPSLKKKRWSLNILGRKRTSNPSTPGGDPAATTTITVGFTSASTSPASSSPAGSPPVLTSGAILGGLGGGRPNRASSGGSDPHRSIDKV